MLNDKDGTLAPDDTLDGRGNVGGRVGRDRCDDHRGNVDDGPDSRFDVYLLDHVGYLVGDGRVTHRAEGFLLGRVVNDPCLLHTATIRQYDCQCNEKIG